MHPEGHVGPFVSRQMGKHKSKSANTITLADTGRSECVKHRPDIQTAPEPTGLFYRLKMAVLTRLCWRKILTTGISKTGHLTITGRYNSHGGVMVSSPERILYTPNNIYGVEGIVFSVRKGTIITETIDTTSTIWRVIALYHPNQILLKRVKQVKE